MVPDIWVYRAANKVIAQHGADAIKVKPRDRTRVGNQQREQALLMVRVKLAVITLQRPPSSALH